MVTSALGTQAKMLSALVSQEDVNRLKRAVGTMRVSAVLASTTKKYGLRRTLIVHSALIELAIKKGN